MKIFENLSTLYKKLGINFKPEIWVLDVSCAEIKMLAPIWVPGTT